jgi:F-type H+-transporting ATPase subunit gamma
MTTLEGIKEKLKVTNELLDIVKAMKALAASSIRRYQKADEASKVYFETLSLGFQIVKKYIPYQFIDFKVEQKIGAIIFGSDLGMCGKFNDQISDFAKKTMKEDLKIPEDDQRLITIGEHVTNNFLDRKIDKKLLFPLSLEGIEQRLVSVLIVVEEWMLRQNIHQIVLFYNKPSGESSYLPTFVKVLPLSLEWLNDLEKAKWQSRSLPTFFMDPKDLFSALIKEYVYIVLYRAFIESLFSENVSRLAAMRYAEKNIEDHIDELKLFFNQSMQNNITEEILEIVEGYEFIKEKKEI